jgi:hypothetical protein
MKMPTVTIAAIAWGLISAGCAQHNDVPAPPMSSPEVPAVPPAAVPGSPSPDSPPQPPPTGPTPQPPPH